MTFDYKDPLEDFVFDSSLLVKKLHFSQGVLTYNSEKLGKINLFYYGFKLPKIVNVETKSGTEKKQKSAPIIIMSDFNLNEIKDKFEKDHNVKFSEKSLLGPRWSLEAIENSVKLKGDYLKTLWDKKKLFDEIVGQYKKYIFFYDERFYELHALWDMGTYFFILFYAYPYIELCGLPDTGKTKAMRTSRQMAFNGFEVTDPTKSTIFRFVEREKPTLYIDEAEKLFRQTGKRTESDDIVELLNKGWEKDAKVPRNDKNESGKWELQMFDVYCPKMLASVKGVPDGAPLKTRCIHNVMVKTPKSDKRGENDINPRDEAFQKIRDNLYPFALQNWSEIQTYYSGQEELQIKNEFGLKNRDWQIWKPLLCVAKVIDPELYKRVGSLAVDKSQNKEDSMKSDTQDGKILSALLGILETATDENKPQEIRPKGIKENIEPDRRGDKPSETKIGLFLNRLGFEKFKKRQASGTVYLIARKEAYDLLITQNLLTKDTQLHTLHKTGDIERYTEEERV